MAKAKKIQKTDHPYQCEFCGQGYQLEKYFINHLCTQKRRWLTKDDKHVKLGYYAWTKFMQRNRQKGEKTYEAFMTKSYYNAFVKFGRHILDIHAIDPENFIDFVLKASVKIDDWCKDYVYGIYLKEWYKKQPPEKSFEQTVLLMQQWGMENDEQWTDFFEKVNLNLAVQWIKAGRISPWVLYNSDKARRLIDRFSPEQLTIIDKQIDMRFWKAKFALQKEDVRFVKSVLKKANL